MVVAPIARALPPRMPIATRVVPAIVVVGCVSAVAGYVQTQLKTNSQQFDKFFSKYNSPESEAARQRVFEDQRQSDPRTSFFNILGW